MVYEMKVKEYKGMALIGPGPHCFRCGTSMKPKSLRLGGIQVRTWRCPKDGEEILHPEDAEFALTINKLRRHGIKVKVGMLNKAPYIRFPKAFNILFQKGDEVTVKVSSENILVIGLHRHKSLPPPSES
jgi:hypothetical protein